jgi:ssRNA-specific RNase YbeY (16S rRNA maturation enzyme)
MCGEIVVNVERAAEAGPGHWPRTRGDRSAIARELALYIAHGCDHLCGADDASRVDRLRMRRRELRWLRAAERDGCLRGLIVG